MSWSQFEPGKTTTPNFIFSLFINGYAPTVAGKSAQS
jgi:hypothetical protein